MPHSPVAQALLNSAVTLQLVDCFRHYSLVYLLLPLLAAFLLYDLLRYYKACFGLLLFPLHILSPCCIAEECWWYDAEEEEQQQQRQPAR